MSRKTVTLVVSLLVISLAGFGRTILGGHADVVARAAFMLPLDVPYPPENPFTASKFDLGKQLFFDTTFSGSRTRSCATCHNPTLSWGDGLARAHGEGKSPLALRSPTLLNVAWSLRLGWDGKFRNLESVAFAPITAPANMNVPEATLIARLQAEPSYLARFAAAFEDGQINRTNIELALATFQRSIVSAKAPFDHWVDGDEGAIDQSAKRGFRLFTGKANCVACHSGWNFTDGSFHDIGTAAGNDIGRGRLFPTSEKLQFAFKTPTLRDVTRRSPYMHNGSIDTLEQVIDLYDRGGVSRPSRSELIRPLGLTQGDKHDLIAFLATLSGAPEADDRAD